LAKCAKQASNFYTVMFALSHSQDTHLKPPPRTITYINHLNTRESSFLPLYESPISSSRLQKPVNKNHQLTLINEAKFHDHKHHQSPRDRRLLPISCLPRTWLVYSAATATVVDINCPKYLLHHHHFFSINHHISQPP
jgi:hypothetical protein